MRQVLTVLAFVLALVATWNLAMAEERGPEPAPDEPRRGPAATDRQPGSPPPPHRQYGPRSLRPPEGERPRYEERRRSGRSPSIFREVTDEQIETILAFIDKHMPWRREALEEMRRSEPERFRLLCRRLRFEVAQLQHLKGRDEAAFRKAIEQRQLRMRAVDLAAKTRTAEDPQEKEAFTKELRKVIDRMFGLELATHEAHIRGLEERIEQLRRELKERAEHRQEIVEKRLKEALEGKPEPPFRGPSKGPPKGSPKRGKHYKEGPRPDKPRRDEPAPTL